MALRVEWRSGLTSFLSPERPGQQSLGRYVPAVPAILSSVLEDFGVVATWSLLPEGLTDPGHRDLGESDKPYQPQVAMNRLSRLRHVVVRRFGNSCNTIPV